METVLLSEVALLVIYKTRPPGVQKGPEMAQRPFYYVLCGKGFAARHDMIRIIHV